MERLKRIIYSRSFLVLLSLGISILVVSIGLATIANSFRELWLILHTLSFLIVVGIINRPMNAAFKLAWVVFVLALPVFGAVFYFIMRFNWETFRYRRTFSAQTRTFHKYMNDNGHHSRKALRVLSEKGPSQEGLGRYMTNHVGYPLYVNSDARYYPSGEAMFETYIRDLKAAKEYIFMEYYIVDFGYMWQRVLDILKEKAKEGVEVRFMYDGMNSLALLPYHYYKRLESYGIKAKVFSQLIPALSTVQNNRDHRKITVIDGKIAYTGGINMADEYINRIQRFGYWKDAVIRVTGEAVTSFNVMFLQMWNFNTKVNHEDIRYLSDQIARFEPEVTDDAVFLPYGENPFNDENVGKRIYLTMFQQARESIDIMTPYLVLDDETLDNLIYAAKRGVRVRILLPSIYDKKTAYLASRTDFMTILKSGIELYEYEPGFVHSKVVLVDGVKATVGSVNLDFRSFYLNFECGLYLYNHPQTLSAISDDFSDSFNKSRQITRDSFAKTYPWYKRLAGYLIKVFSPLM